MIHTKIIEGNFSTLFTELEDVEIDKTIFITDQNIFNLHQAKFDGLKTIVIYAGEAYKQQATVDEIVQQLISLEVDRQYFLVGVGGGVVTDITGYTASIYMRGIQFGFVPTTILAMVDAAIGGKNGVDVGVYKNLVGTIKQPQFLLYDLSFLQTLPHTEWVNGFAEIIKHACIKDEALFEWLNSQSLDYFKNNSAALSTLIKQNVAIKSTIVIHDEFEQGDRKLLNFGHTFGHAIENTYQLPHGHAVSIGIMIACSISEEIVGFSSVEKGTVKMLLEKYELPTTFVFDKQKVWNLMKLDKKRASTTMSFILLEAIGEGIIKKIPMEQLEHIVSQQL
jgi:3-dehydroquinate synthase